MGRIGYVVVVCMVLAISLPTALGHGNLLYDIDLDFDPELQRSVTQAAQVQAGIREVPTFFDLEFELIRVQFDREFERSVLVHPITSEVFGERDDSIIAQLPTYSMSVEDSLSKAESHFKDLPKEVQEELIYTGHVELYNGAIQHRWFRFVEGIYIFDEYFLVEVHPENGKTISWQRSLFEFSKSDLTLHPAFSAEVAESIALQRFDAEAIDFEPFLVNIESEPVWITKVKRLYPTFVAVNALDGRIIFSGGMRGEMPKDYSASLPVKRTTLMEKILGVLA